MTKRGEAILQALRAEARRRGMATDLIVSRWVAERFLHRLSASEHAGRLTLKGAFLFAAWEGDLLRSTLDLDLHSPEEDAADAGRMVGDIAASEAPPDDGVEFAPSEATSVPLLGSRIPGRRVTLGACVGTARARLKVDLSFGQPIRPGPELRQYPGLLPGFPSFPVRTYPRETVVAEKLAVAVEYGRDNTRLRDYWDLWFIASRYRFAGHVLHDAVFRVFSDRDAGTFVGRRDGYWEGAFGTDFARAGSLRAWSDWTARHAPVAGQPSLPEAVAAVSRFAMPVLCSIRDGRPLQGRWSSRDGWCGIATKPDDRQADP